MRRRLHGPRGWVAGAALVASTFQAEAAPPRPPSPAAARRKIPLDLRPLQPRSHVVLTGVLESAVAVTSRGEPVALSNDGVLALAGLDGYPRWTLIAGPSFGPPALDESDTTYIAGRDGRLYAIDRAGVIRWSRALAASPVRGVAIDPRRVAVALENGDLSFFGRHQGDPLFIVRTGRRPSAAPVFTSDGIALLPTQDGLLIVVEPSGASIALKIGDSGAVGPLAVGADGDVYAGTSEGTLVRADPAVGHIHWRAVVGEPLVRSPILLDDGDVVASTAASIVAFTADGALRWRRRFAGVIVGGPVASDDGALFVSIRGAAGASRPGMVVRLDADDGTPHVIPLAVAPSGGLALSARRLWVGLADGTLQSLPVTSGGLAASAWPATRGGSGNAGRPVVAASPALVAPGPRPAR